MGSTVEKGQQRSSKKLIEIKTRDDRYRCAFCHKSEIRTKEWGGLYRYEEIVVHYFCLLFSSALEQNGEDHEGILGFLPGDISKEIRRGSKLRCKYCRKTGATVGCVIKACRTSFHFTCGQPQGTLHEFLDKFVSYCLVHKRERKLPENLEDYECSLCLMDVQRTENAVWSPCCKTGTKIRVFHKECMQNYAYSAGYYHFKCPNCNARSIFRKAMQKSGIYVPERDAAWETEPNAFADLTEVYSKCDSVHCACPNGKDFNDHGDWKIFRCHACGGSAIHRKCGHVKTSKWMCDDCAPVATSGRPSGELTHSLGSGDCEFEASLNCTNPSDIITSSESDTSSIISVSDSCASLCWPERPNHRHLRRRSDLAAQTSNHNSDNNENKTENELEKLRQKISTLKSQTQETIDIDVIESCVTCSPGSSQAFTNLLRDPCNASKYENSLATRIPLPTIDTENPRQKSFLSIPEVQDVCTDAELKDRMRSQCEVPEVDERVEGLKLNFRSQNDNDDEVEIIHERLVDARMAAKIFRSKTVQVARPISAQAGQNEGQVCVTISDSEDDDVEVIEVDLSRNNLKNERRPSDDDVVLLIDNEGDTKMPPKCGTNAIPGENPITSSLHRKNGVVSPRKYYSPNKFSVPHDIWYNRRFSKDDNGNDECMIID